MGCLVVADWTLSIELVRHGGDLLGVVVRRVIDRGRSGSGRVGGQTLTDRQAAGMDVANRKDQVVAGRVSGGEDAGTLGVVLGAIYRLTADNIVSETLLVRSDGTTRNW